MGILKTAQSLGPDRAAGLRARRDAGEERKAWRQRRGREARRRVSVVAVVQYCHCCSCGKVFSFDDTVVLDIIVKVSAMVHGDQAALVTCLQCHDIVVL